MPQENIPRQQLLQFLFDKLDEANIDMVINQTMIPAEDRELFMKQMNQHVSNNDGVKSLELAHSEIGRNLKNIGERQLIIHGKITAYKEILAHLDFQIPENYKL